MLFPRGRLRLAIMTPTEGLGHDTNPATADESVLQTGVVNLNANLMCPVCTG